MKKSKTNSKNQYKSSHLGSNDNSMTTNMDIDKIIEKAMEFSRPDKNESKKLNSIEMRIIKEIKKNLVPEVTEVRSGGSLAKGTNLKNDTDIDIFLLIDKTVSDSRFEGIAMDIGFKSLSKYNPRTRFSEHPYVEGFVKGHKKGDIVKINIVPCYAVEKGEWKSAADRSQYHTEYMIKNLSKDQKDQVRILKNFLKTLGIYGAELFTSGFSGYVSEVLVLKYNTFKDVLINISNLNQKESVISINHDKIIEDLQFHTPVIIIDPIDNYRNLGAAISAESLSTFIVGSRAFLKKPTLAFFNSFQKNTFKKSNKNRILPDEIISNLLTIQFSFSKRSPDVISGQLKKFAKSIETQANNLDFKIIRTKCYIKEDDNIAVIMCLLGYKQLSPYVIHIGPDVFMKDEVTNFLLKNKNNSLFNWTNNEMKVCCLKLRKKTNILDFLNYAIKNNTDIGIPKGLRDDLKKGFKLGFLNKRKLATSSLYNELVYDFIFKNAMIFEE